MPRNRQLLIEGTVYEVVFRVYRGLPLICAPFMRLMILSKLARAQGLYNVVITDLMVMGNHIHMIVVVRSETNLREFVRHFKTEMAVVINQLMGTRGPVWEGCSKPVPILTFETLVERVAYLYSNPVSADLVETVDQYPNVSSWGVFCGRENGEYSVRHIRRYHVVELPTRGELSEGQEIRYMRYLKKLAKERIELKLEPRAAWEVFGGISYDEYRERVKSRVRRREEECKERRQKEGKVVLGVVRLRVQSMFVDYEPR